MFLDLQSLFWESGTLDVSPVRLRTALPVVNFTTEEAFRIVPTLNGIVVTKHLEFTYILY